MTASKHASMLSESSENTFSVTTRLVSSALAVPVGAGQDDGAFESAHDIPNPNVIRGHRQRVATPRAALGGHQGRPLEVLEDLLEEAGRNRLAPRDVLDLRGLPTAVKGDVENGADAVSAFVRELHRVGSMVSHIGIVKNGGLGVGECCLPGLV